MEKLNINLVYLLDDDPAFSQVLELWFKVHGYQIKVFQNVYSFFRGLKHREPDLVILDFIMDDNYEGIKTGEHVTKKINALCNDLPVIMLSAQDNIQVAVDMFRMHIVDYVVKDDHFYVNLKKSIKKFKRNYSFKKRD